MVSSVPKEVSAALPEDNYFIRILDNSRIPQWDSYLITTVEMILEFHHRTVI